MANLSRPNLRPLRYEHLEDRRLLAVVTVNTVEDIVDLTDGRTSLREAIFATNTVSGADEIQFDFDFDGPATLLLTQGELQITDSLTITGPGAELLTIDASGNDPTPDSTHIDGDDSNDGDGTRVFAINIRKIGAEVTRLSGLTVTGADARSGNAAIYSSTQLDIDRLTVTENSGIAVFSVGSLQILDSNIRNNSGLGVMSSAFTTISNSSISGNLGMYGGGVVSDYGTLTITDSTIANNGGVDAAWSGVTANGALKISSSKIVGNSNRADGGGINASGTAEIVDSEISGNHSNHGGGGIRFTGYSDKQLNIRNSVIKNNSSSGFGGGIYGAGEVSIESSVISGNTGRERGGGILMGRGNLTLTSSVVSDNYASHYGGGIAIFSGTATIQNSEISRNETPLAGAGIFSQGELTITSSDVTQSRRGAGIFSRGELNMQSSTVSGNFHGGIHVYGNSLVSHSTIFGNSYGGGILVGGTRQTHFNLRNSTVSGNSSNYGTGGVGGPGPKTISFSTITNNHANPFSERAGVAGGISGGTITLDHSIVAGNINNNGTAHDIDGIFTNTYSLVGVGSEFLAPLADNGGLTLTHALLPGSPAINAGDLNAVAGENRVPAFDQRGNGFDRIVSRIDIGAYEVQTLGDMNLLVDTLDDESDGDFSRGDLSIREAIELANTNRAHDTIRFDESLHGGTILLTQGELQITDSLTIDGPGADLLTIDASGNDPTPDSTYTDGDDSNDGDGSRVLSIRDGIFSGLEEVEIRGVTLTGGDPNGPGGALLAESDAKIINSTIIGNASRLGGGISTGYFSRNISLTVLSSSILENTSFGPGGGIEAFSLSEIEVVSSVIARNATRDSGGGIYFGGSLKVVATTVSDNVALFHGGGVGSGTGGLSLEVLESKITGNTAGSHGGGISLLRYARSQGLAVVSSSTISGNVAGGDGGGIRSSIELRIQDSTVSGNEAAGSGGGIYGWSSNRPELYVSNSTVSGNSANRFGGGIGGKWEKTIAHSTITMNTADADGDGLGGVGGVSGGLMTLDHSIVAGNIDESGSIPDVAIVANSTFSLIGIGGDDLGPLRDNGGPTLTHALLPGSLAINNGNPALTQSDSRLPEFDQRGNPYRRFFGHRIDIGAYEFQPIPGDFDADGDADGDDLTAWKSEYGAITSGSDFLNWQRTFGDGVTSRPQRAIVLEQSNSTDDATIDMAMAAEFTDTAIRPSQARGPIVRRNAYSAVIESAVQPSATSGAGHPEHPKVSARAVKSIAREDFSDPSLLDAAFGLLFPPN